MKLILSFFAIAFLSHRTIADDEIKSKDLGNNELTSQDSSGPSATLSTEQAEELKKQIDVLKEKQIESSKALEAIDKDL